MRMKRLSTAGLTGASLLVGALCLFGQKPNKPGKPGGTPDVQVRVLYLDTAGERVVGDGGGPYADSMPSGVTAILLAIGGNAGNLVFCLDGESPRRRTLDFGDPLSACEGSTPCFGENDFLSETGCHNVNKFDESDPGFLGLGFSGSTTDVTEMWSPIGFTPDDGVESQLQYAGAVVRLVRDGVWEVNSNSDALLRRREPTGRGKKTAFVDKAFYEMPFRLVVCREDVEEADCSLP